jgi:hypothetical protein
MSKVRIPKNVKTTPRCPLCHAMFDRRLDEMVKQRLEQMVAEAIVKFKAANNSKELAKARQWGEMLEASIKGGAAEVFVCHHCKIGIACNDPFVGRWEEAYAKGEKILCPACDHEMRFFCTSTGFMLAQCPVKKCRSRMQLSSPDRSKAGEPNKQLFDDKGNTLALPNVAGAVATPDDMSDAQLGEADDADLPTVDLKLDGSGRTTREGHA